MKFLVSDTELCAEPTEDVFVRKFNEVGGVPFDVRLSPEPFASEAEACDFADAAAKDVIDGAW